jgi:hypothetical protein
MLICDGQVGAKNFNFTFCDVFFKELVSWGFPVASRNPDSLMMNCMVDMISFPSLSC